MISVSIYIFYHDARWRKNTFAKKLFGDIKKPRYFDQHSGTKLIRSKQVYINVFR